MSRLKRSILVPGLVALLGMGVAVQTAEAGDDDILIIRVDLENTGLDPDADGHARLRERTDRTDFEVEVEDLDAGTYDLVVGGVVQASFDVLVDGMEVEIEFQTDPEPGEDDLPLEFDPRLQVVEIAQSGLVYLAVLFPDAPVVGGDDDDEVCEQKERKKKKKKRKRKRNRRGRR